MAEITSLSATQLAAFVRDRRLSPVEVVEAYLRRIEELNPALNAIVTLAPDLMEQARAAEARVMQGEDVGPLHGLPITIKDTIDTAGLKTTSGSRLRADHVPAFDAPAVARLRAAGALILGKTNTAEMAMDYTADNPLFGRTNNPHDASLTPGGSSGGEAAAIAAQLSAGGLGTDLAGSIRIPAHFCGIAGLKPGCGRVPPEAEFPESIGPYSLGSVVGPMGRNVADLRLLFKVLSGTETDIATPLANLRVAWYAHDGVVPVTSETRSAVEAAARALSDAGFLVEERRPPGVERGLDLWLKIFSRATVVFLHEQYDGREADAGPFIRWRLATADDRPPPTLDQYIRDWMERDHLRDALLKWMETTPLLICPVGATPAYPHDAHKVTVDGQTMNTFRSFSYSQTFNVYDLPSVSIRAGRSPEGLPIGVQIVGRPGGELTVLAAAEIIEQTLSDTLKEQIE
jgi:amidase